MTKFKQIVGRGTRINEEYDKLYFTILDFRNVTDLFADKEFDGDPIRVKPVTEDTDLGNIVTEEELLDTPIIDEATGDEIEIRKPEIRYPGIPTSVDNLHEPREKVYVNGVDVTVLVSREMHFDNDGKPITTNLKDHTREIIQGQFATLDDFLNKWNSSEQKEVLIKELEVQGVLVNALRDAVDREVDLFDLICHVAYDQPPMTRKERANNVRKRNHFTKYGEQARKVLDALLEKYADEGVTNIENVEILRVKPFDDFGSPMEIFKQFGSKDNYLEAIKELEKELFKTGA
jgi:type I restriction enzyme R subunit